MANNLAVAGRTYDIVAFQPPTGSGTVPASLTFNDGGTGEAITGIYKLAQRVLIEFLTETGSMPFLPARGTSFMTAVRQGLLRTDLDIHQQFAFAAGALARNLTAEDAATDPDDEKLGTIELGTVTFSGDLLILPITVTSRAGTSVVVQAPITTSP